MIRHIVMFRLKEEISKDILPEVKARALSLRDKIPFIRSMEVHTGAAGVPDSIEALDVYRDHPAHVAFREYITPLRELRACFDFEY